MSDNDKGLLSIDDAMELSIAFNLLPLYSPESFLFASQNVDKREFGNMYMLKCEKDLKTKVG